MFRKKLAQMALNRSELGLGEISAKTGASLSTAQRMRRSFPHLMRKQLVGNQIHVIDIIDVLVLPPFCALLATNCSRERDFNRTRGFEAWMSYLSRTDPNEESVWLRRGKGPSSRPTRTPAQDRLKGFLDELGAQLEDKTTLTPRHEASASMRAFLARAEQFLKPKKSYVLLLESPLFLADSTMCLFMKRNPDVRVFCPHRPVQPWHQYLLNFVDWRGVRETGFHRAFSYLFGD
jgi:hypothetical protein